MNTKQKWEYFLERYERVKAMSDLSVMDDRSREDFSLIEKMLSRTIVSTNKKCDMTSKSGLDPTNFSYLLKQYFWSVKESEFRKLLESRVNDAVWIPDYEISQIQPEYYKMMQERWQLHARLSLLLVKVNRVIKIDFAPICRYSDSYTIVVYKMSHEVVGSAGSLGGELEKEIFVTPGWYLLSLRFYSDQKELFLPRVVVDGTTEIDSYHDHSHAQFTEMTKFWMNRGMNPIYFVLNFHTFFWLKYETEKMPEEVSNDFLPVANPDTEWEYGYLEEGQRVRLQLDEEVLGIFRVYVTFVNELSLPIYLEQATCVEYVSAKIREDGAFHIRFVRRGQLEEEIDIKQRYTVYVEGED